MTVYELIEVLERLDGKSDVLIQQTFDVDDGGKFSTLAKIAAVRAAFAAQIELDLQEWDISACEEVGQKNSSGYPIASPVVVLDSHK